MERGARSSEEKSSRRENGILFGSGLVGGEGLFGVAIAAVVFYQKWTGEPGMKQPMPGEIGHIWFEPVPTLLALFVFFLLAFMFARRCRR